MAYLCSCFPRTDHTVEADAQALRAAEPDLTAGQVTSRLVRGYATHEKHCGRTCAPGIRAVVDAVFGVESMTAGCPAPCGVRNACGTKGACSKIADLAVA